MSKTMEIILLGWDIISVIVRLIILGYIAYAAWHGAHIKSGAIEFYIKPLSRFFQ